MRIGYIPVVEQGLLLAQKCAFVMLRICFGVKNYTVRYEQILRCGLCKICYEKTLHIGSRTLVKMQKIVEMMHLNKLGAFILDICKYVCLVLQLRQISKRIFHNFINNFMFV